VHKESATADKTAWLYSALVGNLSHHFTKEDVQSFVKKISSAGAMTALGRLEAITNLLKSTEFRQTVWGLPDARRAVEIMDAKSKPNEQYKCVFAIWMLSFEVEIAPQFDQQLKEFKAVDRIKNFLTADTKVEKVVRLSLVVLENFLTSKALQEDIATTGVLQAVQALEYEKWRDAELYGQIVDVSRAISSAVSEVSKFDRYLKELQSEKLRWGYLHTTKFWAENYTNPDLNEDVVDALKKIIQEKSSYDPESAAVACNDIGEIAVFHDRGKKWIESKRAKESVMQQMDNRDRMVRREALLCCQKIMLNNWQGIPQK